jgi:hypothetical protein
MQDHLTLRNELPDVLALGLCPQLEVVLSHEMWNPVSAVVLRDVKMPEHVAPSTSDWRIPIPNLYGFARHATVLLFDSHLSWRTDDEVKASIPCVRSVGEHELDAQRASFVDVRERTGWPREFFYLFLTPEWRETGFRHRALATFCETAMAFFAEPVAFLRREIVDCERKWHRTKNPWWLTRIAQIHLELGESGDAEAVLKQGRTMFPSHQVFTAPLNHASVT